MTATQCIGVWESINTYSYNRFGRGTWCCVDGCRHIPCVLLLVKALCPPQEKPGCKRRLPLTSADLLSASLWPHGQRKKDARPSLSIQTSTKPNPPPP